MNMSPAEIVLNYAPFIYRVHSSLRAEQVKRQIEREFTYYHRLHREVGMLPPLTDRIRARVSARGIVPALKPLANVHVLYVSRPSVWEPHNIPPELSRMCCLTTYFYGERGFNDRAADWVSTRHKLDEDLYRFVSEIHAKKPVDVFVGYLSGWQISPETIQRIGELGIVTCGFHLDDKVSFRGEWAGGRWSGPAALASSYDLNLTSTQASIMKYEVEGGNAMFWPEGANPEHFKPLNLPAEYDVSFIGARYGYRPILIDYLRNNGVKVETFGPGWPNGPVDESEMVKIYAKSRINLGFGGIGYSQIPHLKGRDFEVPMSGGIYLTTENPELRELYDVGKDIFVYRTEAEAVDIIGAILSRYSDYEAFKPEIRRKCLNRHRWSARFLEVFRALSIAK